MKVKQLEWDDYGMALVQTSKPALYECINGEPIILPPDVELSTIPNWNEVKK